MQVMPGTRGECCITGAGGEGKWGSTQLGGEPLFDVARHPTAPSRAINQGRLIACKPCRELCWSRWEVRLMPHVTCDGSRKTSRKGLRRITSLFAKGGNGRRTRGQVFLGKAVLFEMSIRRPPFCCLENIFRVTSSEEVFQELAEPQKASPVSYHICFETHHVDRAGPRPPMHPKEYSAYLLAGRVRNGWLPGQWRRISRPISADDRVVETERPNLLYVPHIAESTTPADLNRGERLHAETDLNPGARLHTERIRSALSLSARRPPSDNESSDDEDIFASDDEHNGWRDPDHRLTVLFSCTGGRYSSYLFLGWFGVPA
ncbi:hypothetical protein B0H14DRAFT_2656140 [Mycena olivaceomarginata]|nr:hypothetical protein B0H14DRAFT_2656140 [Mycena olivaceomarginata]